MPLSVTLVTVGIFLSPDVSSSPVCTGPQTRGSVPQHWLVLARSASVLLSSRQTFLIGMM